MVLLFSFMMFILSMPFAIAVLVQAVRAESAWVDRMNDECLRLSISAGFWLKISVITMALQILLLVGGCLYFVSLMR